MRQQRAQPVNDPARTALPELPAGAHFDITGPGLATAEPPNTWVAFIVDYPSDYSNRVLSTGFGMTAEGAQRNALARLPEYESKVYERSRDPFTGLPEARRLQWAEDTAKVYAGALALAAVEDALKATGWQLQVIEEVTPPGYRARLIRGVPGMGAETMTSHSGRTIAEALALLAAHLDKAPIPANLRSCTGLGATWCPIHGDCTCPPDAIGTTYTCPLHGATSTHAEAIRASLPPPPDPRIMDVR